MATTVLIVLAAPVWAVKPTPAEMARAHEWATARFGDTGKAATA
jgi:hypothetical protein